MIATLVSTAVLAVGAPEGAPPAAHRHPRHHAGHHRGCQSYRCDRRVTRRYRRNRNHRMWRVVRPYNAKLNRMAQCESSGRWHINGRFSGGLQFLPSTWWSVGGSGMPHWHSPLEQKYRAVLLIRREGYSPWPNCGYR